VIGRYLGQNTLSAEHFVTIRNWLADCLKHPKCCQSLSGEVSFYARNVILPTRCIDVSEESIRLAETSGTYGSYIILSHRWKKETEVASTTKENHDARKIMISLEELPTTFRDAICVARLLDVKYIWIDSICIIQGDDADWASEAIRMAEYYQQSLLTLAATQAAEENEDRGLFFNRDTESIRDLVRMPYRDISGQSRGYFYVHKRVAPVEVVYNFMVRQSALMKRGWIFQEEMLSRRVVHFLSYELFFECATNIASNECGETVTDGRFYEKDTHFALKASLNYTAHQDFDALWYKVVETYSALELTKSKDRLVALAGIAKEHRAAIARHNISNYVPEYTSGLWLRDIPRGLLWELADVSKADVSECGAPSWSWASQNGQVKWAEVSSSARAGCKILALVTKDGQSHQVEVSAAPNDKALASHSRLQVANASNINKDTFGVSSVVTQIQIRGRLVPVVIRHFLKDVEGMAYRVGKMTGHSLPSGRENWRAICAPTTPELLSGWILIDQPKTRMPPSVIALLVSTQREPGGLAFGYLSFSHPVQNVLYLQKVKDDIFERIGIGRIFDRGLVQMFDAVQDETFYLA
jgi:Heterokaryon incompatibility protein (HET)